MEAWCWMPPGVKPPVDLRTISGRQPVVRVTPQVPADRPSIAVLALDVLSSDADAGTIADGVVEEITATLSRIRDFTVIARNSAYVYKGKAHDIREIGRALGVRYVLEGSLRKQGNQVRVTAQVIEAESGSHMWAHTYTGSTDDIFGLQDRIAEEVAGALRPSIRAVEIEQAKRKRPENLVAYDLVLRAMPYLWASDRADNEEAIRLLDQAMALDPKYHRAATFAAWARAQQVLFGWADDTETARREGGRLADRAAAMSSDDPTALTALATAAMLLSGDLDRAEMLIDRALSLDSNNAWAWSRKGFILIDRGKTEEATHCFERALRLSPLDPFSFNSYLGLGMASFAAGDADKAIEWTRRGMRENVTMTWAERDLAAYLGAAGRLDEAKAAVSRLLASHPDASVSRADKSLPFMHDGLKRRFLDGLRKAGLPE
jgi:adenylate cyclase